MAAGSFVLAAGHLHAQPMAPRGGTGASFVMPRLSDDEVFPQLIAGPNGEILRLWQRSGDQKTGGGGVMLAVASGPDRWQTLVEIRSPERGVTIRDGQLAISPSRELALVYRWWRDQPRSKQLRLARSTDAGKTWAIGDTPIDTSGKAFHPRIGWGRGKGLVVAWDDERRGGRKFDVYARRSSDGGVTWEPEQLLSRFPEKLNIDVFARPQLVADGQDRFWVVWVGVKGGRSVLYMNRSTDGGRTWTDPMPLTGQSRSVFGHQLYRAGDRMLLIWTDDLTERDRVYAISSGDGGATWTVPVRVDHLPDSLATDAVAPAALLGDDGEVLVVWQDGRNGRDDIFLGRSADGGRTWGTADERMDADEAGTAVSRYPRLARAGDGRVALAWEDDRDGLEEIYLRVRAARGGREWSPEVRASSPAPKLATHLPQPLWAQDGSLYIAWEVWDHTLSPGSVSKRVEGKLMRVGDR
jgi:hypothetical protein